ncbi:protein unc-13 homolog isoform X2 [Humulus lupulus]|uniref:protein unc-13 homolog isoform X2 n=1 Tax=Humulus lupulus TaxID=3486 RepID=UPI002B40FA85|nr:protein unc-13 homolog isoform X2 [Humulus lupulus]
MEEASVLQRYRSDRRKLLEFLLSSSSGATTATFLSDIDFDNLSVDYVIDCLISGSVVDVSEARKKKLDELNHPSMIYSQSGSSYFLLTNPELAGLPPLRAPPPVTVEKDSCSTKEMDSSNGKYNGTVGHDYKVTTNMQPKTAENVKIPPLGLPNLRLSDDDLRESAYEILLASISSSGVEVHKVEPKKKEKNGKFLLGLKNKKDKAHTQPQCLDRHSQLIRTFRLQMQISEAMDVCIRRRLQLTRGTCGKTDIPQISLGLLNSTFKSDFLHEKSYLQWKSRQAGILEELLLNSANLAAADHLTIKCSLARIRNAEEWDTTMSPSERVEVLTTIKHVALKLSSLPGQFGIESETCYWTAGYHLNVRLYEKLLLSVFDILDEGQLIEEADEILTLIKLTWSTLGITQKIHNVIFGWVLFLQFAQTDEAKLLEHATLELQKVASVKEDDKERNYIESLLCSRQSGRKEVKLSLIQAIFFTIGTWCDSKLQDYHLHFRQQLGNFKRVVSLAVILGIPTSDHYGEIKFTSLNIPNKASVKRIKSYVERSTEAAYKRVASTIDLESKMKRKHPLCLLANELRLIVERERNVFYPVLHHWYPESGMIIAMQLHQIYGERLKIYLDGVSCLSEDVKSVLPAADLLDHDLTKLYTASGASYQDLHHYPIGEVAKPLILDWVIAQHSRILEWTGRAFDLEGWEPLSLQQRQAASIVEVFRIIEETVDQLFGLNLPMDITHIQALLSISFHTLRAYLEKMFNQFVEKNHLYPSAPSLTRYKDTSIPIMKKKLLEAIILDDNLINKLNHLTVSKLCVRINTLKYIEKQIHILEDGIRKSWALVRKPNDGKRDESEPHEITSCEEVDELFANTFNIIKDTSLNGIKKICDFIGPRVVFWDLRDGFISSLYSGSVEDARLDSVLPHLDTVLDHVCGLIDDTLRDCVILSIYRASLEGFVRVLLDGGPSRAFSDSDIILMEDDLAMLKELFVANGEGLDCSLVEQEAKFAERLLGLYSVQTETVVQMLMTASEQISMGLESHDNDRTNILNVHTLMRILCHKKDREASKFLKIQYNLPMSSEYEDNPSKDSTSTSPFISDFLKRSTSFQWSNKSQSSFNSFKKKLQEATSDITR